jgi:hypothetical protein
MKRITLLLSGFVFAAALHAQTVESIPYRAVLLATNEPTPIVDATARGIATIWLHLIRDATGKVTSGTVDFNANFQFAIAETVTLAHIHRGLAGIAGPVVIGVPFTRFDQPSGAGSLPVRQFRFRLPTQIARRSTPSTEFSRIPAGFTSTSIRSIRPAERCGASCSAPTWWC